MAKTLRRLYPNDWKTENLDTLLMHAKTRQMILDDAPWGEIETGWKPELEAFLKSRNLFLLYE